jgi:DNA-binding MarR family transcriptional regulator
MEKEPLIKWISIIYRYSLIYANKKLKDFDITGGELSFFIYIVDMEGITQEELSNHLKINKSTTAKAVKSLEKKGYVTKKIYDKDKRSYNLYPTKKAVELRKQMRKLAFSWNDILLCDMEKKDKQRVYELIVKMAENADNFINRSESDE